jgi:hypothetical protein
MLRQGTCFVMRAYPLAAPRQRQAQAWRHTAAMPTALIAALFFTVALLVTTAYFLMGSVPLLILKHDTPVDARFVRGFFNTYYLAALFTASATALSYAWAGKLEFAAGAAGLALLAWGLRSKIIPTMDAYRSQIPLTEPDAIPGFRRLHWIAIGSTLAQLVLIVWSLTALSPP